MDNKKLQSNRNLLNEQYGSTRFRLSDNGFTYIYDGSLEELMQETKTVDAFQFLTQYEQHIPYDKHRE